MTLAEMRTQIRYRVGRRSDLTSGDGLTVANYCINRAQRQITHTFRFSELEAENTSRTTVNNVDTVAVPTPAYAVLSVFDVTNTLFLRPLPGGWESYERTRSTSTAHPTQWLRFADLIYFRPRPNGAFNLRMGIQTEPADLTVDGDQPVIPPVWHDGIIILATIHLWRSIDEDERADALERGEWRSFLSQVRTPKALESHVSKVRGLRVQRYLSNRDVGI